MSTTPSRTERLGAVTVHAASVSEQDNISYVITAPSGEQLIVDAANDAAQVLAPASAAGGPVRTVVTTHQHWDHHRALAEVVARTGARTAAGREDAAALPVDVDTALAHGDQLAVDAGREVVLDVIALRGHTPGSVAFALTEAPDADHPGRVHIFSGDSLFPGGIGRTTTPADFASLIADVEQRLFDRYPDDTVVWPGHGKATTLGAERPHLPEWQARGW